MKKDPRGTARRHSLERKLAAYGAATTALLAAGAIDAQAQVACQGGKQQIGDNCYTDVNPDVTVSAGTTLLDFDGDGDAEVEVYEAPGSHCTTSFPSFTSHRNCFPNNDARVRAAGAGDNLVGALGVGLGALRGVGSGYLISSGNANFQALTNFDADALLNQGDKYSGVRISIDGKQYLGWIRLEVVSTGGSIGVRVKEYAFNNTVENGSITTGFTSLPVELTSFEAVADGAAAVLRWQTASETNNAGFEVQQRRGDDWQAVSFVAGHGTTAAAQRYEHRVEGLAAGRHTFRLKQVDYDGAFEYSPEVEAAVAMPAAHALSDVYPNPFNPQASFTLAVAQAQAVRVALYDVLGREVRVVHTGVLAGSEAHRFTVEGAGLPSGTYLLRAIGETFSESRRVTLLK